MIQKNSDPNVLVLGGRAGAWSAAERKGEAPTMNGIEAWVFALGGDYSFGPMTDVNRVNEYDIVIANLNPASLPVFREMLRLKRPETKFVVLVEGSATDYLSPMAGLLEVLDGADLVNSINRFSTDYFRALTKTRVEYIGIPYPAEYIRSLAVPFDKRRKEIFLTTRLLDRWAEYITVRDLGIPFYGYERKLSRTWRKLVPNLLKFQTVDKSHFLGKTRKLYHDDRLEIRLEDTLEGYFMNNRHTSVWLDLDPRYTWGRYVLDAAALQIPIVATRSTGHADVFFPSLTIETPFDVHAARERIMRLFTDEDFYRDVSNIPLEKFEHLRPEVMKRTLLDLLYR